MKHTVLFPGLEESWSRCSVCVLALPQSFGQELGSSENAVASRIAGNKAHETSHVRPIIGWAGETVLQDPKKEKAVLLTVITPQKNHPESFSSESEKREECTDPWEMVQGLQRTSDDVEGFQEAVMGGLPMGRLIRSRRTCSWRKLSYTGFLKAAESSLLMNTVWGKSGDGNRGLWGKGQISRDSEVSSDGSSQWF